MRINEVLHFQFFKKDLPLLLFLWTILLCKIINIWLAGFGLPQRHNATIYTHYTLYIIFRVKKQNIVSVVLKWILYIIILLQLTIRRRSNRSAPRDTIKNAIKRILRSYHLYRVSVYNKYLGILYYNKLNTGHFYSSIFVVLVSISQQYLIM